MRISRLELDGIGPFEKAVFELPEPAPGNRGELVLFEGPNGAGKTTIAQAIGLAASPVLYERFGGASLYLSDEWSRRFRSDVGASRVEIEHDGQRSHLRMGQKSVDWFVQATAGRRQKKTAMRLSIEGPSLSWEPDEESHAEHYIPPLVPGDWAAYTFSGHQPTPTVGSNGPQPIDHSSVLSNDLSFGVNSAGHLLGQLLTNLEYERVRAAQYANEAPPPKQKRLKASAKAREGALRRMESALSKVLNREVKIRFGLDQIGPKVLFDGQEIPLDLLGEGLRTTIAWLADLLVRLELTPWQRQDISPFEQDFWLVLDEVEVNLHPQMQARLFPALRELFPNARIYATTHSPFAVASAADGHVFSIRPDLKTRGVSGPQEATKLAPGQSLAWVIQEVFDTSSTFLDEKTKTALAEHNRDVRELRAGRVDIEWDRFLENRRWLMGLNDELSAIVAMREVPVRRRIDEKQREVA
jgi:AAA domain, putative AbiEii toxin, Type IV TA system/AAA domain